MRSNIKLSTILVLQFSIANTVYASNLVTEIEDVHVTANKVTQRKIDVPSSISVFDSEQINKEGLRSINDLTLKVPNFTMQAPVDGDILLPVMRGITTGATTFSTPVLLTVDGIPSYFTAFGYENNLLGVESIEVLKGPQSTMHGKNAEMGVINLKSREINNDPYLMTQVDIGSRKKNVFRFDASTPLVRDRLWIGLQGEYFKQDGIVTNIYDQTKNDDRQRNNAKLTLKWAPTDQDILHYRASIVKYNDGSSRSGLKSEPYRTTNVNDSEWNHSKGWNHSLSYEHQFDNNIKFNSVTAYSYFHDLTKSDGDNTPENLSHQGKDYYFKTISQEMRLSKQTDKFDNWIVGIYADKQDSDIYYGVLSNSFDWIRESKIKYNNLAIFGQVTKPITQKTALLLGMRMEKAKINLNPKNQSIFNSKKSSWNNISPKLSLIYQINDRNNVYLTYGKGFRTGGYNVFAQKENFPLFDPEKIDSYELGIKGHILQNRLGYELSAYYNNSHNMQVQMSLSPGTTYITNAASAHSKGIDLTFDYMINENWDLLGSLGYNHTRFKKFVDYNGNYNNNHNTHVPDFTGSLSLKYNANKNWFTQVSLSGASKAYTDFKNEHMRNSYMVVDYLIGYNYKQIELLGYINNLANRNYDSQSRNYVTFSPPRELGVRLNYKF